MPTGNASESNDAIATVADPPWICPACACLCHDVPPAPGAIACDVASRWADDIRADWPDSGPVDSDCEAAAVLIRDAVRQNRPIHVVGLERLHWEAQKAVLTLAERVGATIAAHGEPLRFDPWAAAFEQFGSWAATWSEIRFRADFLLFWYAPVWRTHPRWIERFSPRAHARRLAVVESDGAPLPEGWIEEQILRVDPAESLYFVRAVRLGLRSPETDMADDRVARVVHAFVHSRWASLIRGAEPAGITDPFGLAESWAGLIQEANTVQRRVITAHVPAAVGEAGASSLLSVRAGIAAPMRFAASGPVSARGESLAEPSTLELRFDPHDPPAGDRPSIWFDQGFGSAKAESGARANGSIVLPAARLGLDAQGTLIRPDGVSIFLPLRANSRRQSVEAIVARILVALDSDPLNVAESNDGEPPLTARGGRP